MKYIFRDYTIFEYMPERRFNKVKQHWVSETTPAFNYCSMIPEDYKLLSQFFDTVYRHIQGEDVELKDINVN